MTAQELKIGDSFRRNGFKFTVASITPNNQVNGTPVVTVWCYTNDNTTEPDSVFHFKLATKINLSK